MTDQRDPWNPTSADLRFAADVLHGCVGEIEASADGMPTSDPASQCVEQLRHDADEMDAKELARTAFPHVNATELAMVTEVFLSTIRAELPLLIGLYDQAAEVDWDASDRKRAEEIVQSWGIDETAHDAHVEFVLAGIRAERERAERQEAEK